MPEFTIKGFNKYADENKSLLQKALTSATGVGGALIPENLEKEITNTIIRMSPEIAILEPGFKKIAGKTHEFNRLTALPGIGGAQGESSTTPTRNSTTVRDTVTLKIVKRKGAVTNFLQDTSEENIDAAAYEMENHITSHIYDLINYFLYGNPNGNKYEYGGLDYFIGNAGNNNRKNEARFGQTPTSLKFLDDMIDISDRKGGSSHRRAFLMSPEMLSHCSRLLTNVRINQESVGKGLSIVEIPGGWRLFSYRDIPIVPSAQTRNTNTMGTVTPSAAGAGSGLTDATYYFKVAKVTQDGESLAHASNVTTSSNDTITLTWTAETDAYRFKIYCSTTQHAETLVTEISGFNYDANGNITANTTTVTFSTDPNSANPTISAPANLLLAISGNTVPSYMQSDISFEQDSGHDVPEIVALWDLDPIQGLGKVPYTNRGGSNFGGLVTTKELAETDDFMQFLVKSYPALAPSYDGTSVWHRGKRTY
jgi:hypothetical protein